MPDAVRPATGNRITVRPARVFATKIRHEEVTPGAQPELAQRPGEDDPSGGEDGDLEAQRGEVVQPAPHVEIDAVECDPITEGLGDPASPSCGGPVQVGLPRLDQQQEKPKDRGLLWRGTQPNFGRMSLNCRNATYLGDNHSSR
ncbi:hypothetical protein Psi02_57110 [Planotetraspora silvatica]|uniref:Uncharacterized protein n=1 Tax=Planotetraspora silvatica TaxID=234614 RepID=A0A8J3UT34_9ACTN|nr:hypothetical protein Psi02_57110 [Planotetraspora silvatica]